MVRLKSTDRRRQARALALQGLFSADVRGDYQVPPFEWLDEDEAMPQSALDFATKLLSGVFDTRLMLDGHIGRYAPAWPVSQLSLIDRNILRIAIFELLYTPGTPRKTAINEGVELAKVFGSESSARFINGVLGSVMAGLESGELTACQETAGEVAAKEPVSEGR